MTTVPVLTFSPYGFHNEMVTAFTDMQTMATASYTSALNYLSQLQSIIAGMDNIDTTVTLDPVSTTSAINLLPYLSLLPTNPISDAEITAITSHIPLNTFSFAETLSNSDLLVLIKSKFTDIINNGGTGLNATIEADIFERETERDAIVNADAKDQIASDWAERGFSIPSAGLFNISAQVDIDYQNKQLDKSRAIAEETRKLEIDGLKTSLQLGIQEETFWHEYLGRYWERQLNASKAILEEGIAIMNAYIAAVKSKVEIFDSESRAFGAQMGALGEIAKVDVEYIKSQVEYAVAKANVKVEEIKATLMEFDIKIKNSITAQTSGATVAAHLAAAALSAVNIGVTHQTQDTYGHDYSMQLQEKIESEG